MSPRMNREQRAILRLLELKLWAQGRGVDGFTFADVKEHPIGDFHGFMGFPEFMAVEKEFLPASDERYEGTLGYRHDGEKKKA